MRLTINSGEFYRKLQAVTTCQNSKNVLPILDCVLLKVEAGNLILVGSNSEMEIKSSTPLVECDGDFMIAVDSKNLKNAISALGDQPVTLTAYADTHALEIAYNRGKVDIVFEDANDFPTMPDVTGDTSAEIDASVLRDAMGRTSYAMLASNSDGSNLRPQMVGVYMEVKTGSVMFAATDGHKLVRDIYTVPSLETPFDIILPAATIPSVKAILGKGDGNVTVKSNGSNACIATEEYEFRFRSIEGRYPNVNSVIPAEQSHHAVAAKADIVASIRRVSMFADSGTDLIALMFKSGKLTVQSRDINFSRGAEETIDIDYDGEEMNIGISSKFILDTLTRIPDENVSISFENPTQSVIFRSVYAGDDSNEDLLMLLVPMVINQ